jgi:hypothetical protein
MDSGLRRNDFLAFFIGSPARTFSFLQSKERKAKTWGYIRVCTPTYVLTVIPAKSGIYREYEAWIPAFAGMTMWLFLAIRQYEALCFC